ncbi:MAG: T9SS type A sorting domain-containing protein [Bacteroidota bacterium]
MKKNNWLLFSYWFIVACTLGHTSPLSAQALCVQTPSTSTEFAECNREIAATFAPVIVQYVTTDTPHGLGGNADRIVPYNFDGDWNGFNNWSSANTPADPTVYYHVHWTETFWVITYTLYWARDFAANALPNNGCNQDLHEGDSDKIIITVARPTEAGVDAADLAMGVASTHHGMSSLNTCVNDQVSVSDSDPHISGGATHTIIGSSPGSHALYNDHTSAHNDDGTLNPCQPDDEATITYRPGSTPVRLPIGGDTEEVYILEDVLADGGLWDHRFDPQAFPEWGEFACNNYCSGPGLASAPWNGFKGTDPLCWFWNQCSIHGVFPRIHCDCQANPQPDCESTALGCEPYEFDPFACSDTDAFNLISSSETICQIEGEVTLTLQGLPTPMPQLTWIIPPGMSLVPANPGDPANQITITSNSSATLGTIEVDVIIETPTCFPKIIKAIEVVQDIAIDYHTEDGNAHPTTLFCPGENVMIDAEGITGEQSYRIVLFKRPINTPNDPFQLDFNSGWITGSMSDWFNLSHFATAQGYQWDFHAEYEIKISIQGDCPKLKMKQNFSFIQEYGLNELASLEILDENHQPSDAFCVGDLIFADGSGSLYVNSYAIRLNRRPVGTSFWLPFYLPPSATNGSMGVIELNTLLASEDLSFEAGYEYQAILSIHGTCFGVRVAMEEFTVYNCLPPPCNVPQNLRCENEAGSLGRRLSWTAVAGATSYQVYIDASAAALSACDCAEGNVSTQTVLVNQAYYLLPFNLVNECFQWKVKANCGEGYGSTFSTPICYTGHSSCGVSLDYVEPSKSKHFSPQLQSNVYPNPSSGQLNIELNAPEAFTLIINIYTIEGQLVRSMDKGYIDNAHYQEQWDSDLAQGLYFLVFKTSLGQHQEKIWIQQP